MIKLVETLRDVNCDRCDEKILNMRCDATRTLEHWNMQLHTLHYRWGSQTISEIFFCKGGTNILAYHVKKIKKGKSSAS